MERGADAVGKKSDSVRLTQEGRFNGAYRALEVSRAGFYHWRLRPLSPRRQEDERLKVAIRVAHGKTRQTYGAVRLQAELAAEGFYAGRDRIGRLRREMGLSCKQKRKLKATTHSSHSLPVAENLLGQVFCPLDPTKSGLVISPISPPTKAGSIWLVSRMYLPVK